MLNDHKNPTPQAALKNSRKDFFILSVISVFIGIVSFFILNDNANAGEYHNPKQNTYLGLIGDPAATETLACSQCHSMHGTQGGASMLYDGSAEPYPRLLRHSSVLNLCLYCHDGNNAGLDPPPPDIWGTTMATGQTNPSAGNLCAGYDVTPPCTDTTINHSLGIDVTSTMPPGFAGGAGGWSVVTAKFSTTFNCLFCHDQHGNTNYRNLRTDPGSSTGVSVTYAMGATINDATKHVNNLVDPGRGVLKYETDNVKYRGIPAATATDGIQAFCKGCHNNFHYGGGESAVEFGGSASGDAGTTPWKRHPTKDTSINTGDANKHVDKNCWMAGTTASGCASDFTAWARTINPDGIDHNGDEVPFCFTCHRVHGSSNHTNLIFGGPTSLAGAGTKMRDTCMQCHNQ